MSIIRYKLKNRNCCFVPDFNKVLIEKMCLSIIHKYMSAERRSCLDPIIHRIQLAFAEDRQFIEVINDALTYRGRVESNVTNVSRGARWIRCIAMSTLGLTLLTSWEYLRSQGVPLPDSREIVGLMPITSISPPDEPDIPDIPDLPKTGDPEAIVKSVVEHKIREAKERGDEEEADAWRRALERNFPPEDEPKE